jgi:rhodanese-related sulfurtransferase
MNWTLIAIIAVVFISVLMLKRLILISPQKARAFLRDGAVLVDVRTPEEFRSGHLPGATNVPLGVLKQEAERSFPNKDKVVLLHCLSGTRSGIAARILKQQGYAKVFNLGSYGRAQKIVNEKE